MNYSLNIAGYIIKIETTSGAYSILPAKRFKNFLCTGFTPDITIRIRADKFIPEGPITRVFHAPYFEEELNKPVKKADEFWSVYTEKENLLINIKYPEGKPAKESWLRFSLTDPLWDLFITSDEETLDPLSYPLDGLILYYLTVMKGDIFIHGAGVNYEGKGYLFTGTSGRGKTTMARLWHEAGARVVHDDRLIIRNINGSYIMYNTPVYDNEFPFQSTLNNVYIIAHGDQNETQPLQGANALTNIMANCIQHNWNHEIISGLTNALYNLSKSVGTKKLFFKPDNSIISYILSNG